jgi:hypothetical protein
VGFDEKITFMTKHAETGHLLGTKVGGTEHSRKGTVCRERPGKIAFSLAPWADAYLLPSTWSEKEGTWNRKAGSQSMIGAF